MNITVFVSYAEIDESWWKKIETRLRLHRPGSTNSIELWDPNKDIVPGKNRRQEINKHVETARIFLLLLSFDYLVDEECQRQMQAALKRKQEEEDQVDIIPILLRPCSWEDIGLEELEILPHNKVPISSWPHSDEVLLEVYRGIQKTINDNIDKNKSNDTHEVSPTNPKLPLPNSSDKESPADPKLPQLDSTDKESPMPTSSDASPNPQNVMTDVAIIIALKEEFSDLFSEFGASYEAIEDSDTNAFYYSFERNSREAKRSYHCITTFVGDMGPLRAGLLAQKTIMRWKPTTVVLIGLAGALNSSVKLGDIVVADQVDGYLENAKVSPIPGTNDYDFALSGDVYRTSARVWNAAQHFEFSKREAYLAWQKATEEKQRTLLGKQRFKLLGEDMMHEQAQIIKGHIASGPVVVAAKTFADWLKTRDRKYMAIEMESLGVMAAVNEHPIMRDTLILRAISDDGKEDKSTLDNIGGGVIRRYAMSNAIQLLWSFLDTGMLSQQS